MTTGERLRNLQRQLYEANERRIRQHVAAPRRFERNDLDIYEGRYGLEDTRHAIHEARAAGLTPFCVTIDESAHDYLPMLFGRQGYAVVHRPQDLVRRLTQAWSTLAR